MRLLVDWAWQCGLRRVQLYARLDNIGSQRVAEKAGLRRERVATQAVKGDQWEVVWYGLSRPEQPLAV